MLTKNFKHYNCLKNGSKIKNYFFRALQHDQEHMGKRYIEIKEAKHSEMEWIVNKMVGPSGDNIVRLRGLPYGCTKQDIDSFFSGK